MNKAVVGAVALTAGWYSVNERWKDRQVEQEREERRQLEEDRENARWQREQQAKEKRNGRRCKGNETVGGEQRLQEFSSRVHGKVSNLLWKCLVETAGVHNGSSRSSSQRLHFPLLSNSPEKEDVMLAVALAFGDNALVLRVAEEIYRKHKLGISLWKFESKTMDGIISRLRATTRRMESQDDRLDMELKHLTLIASLAFRTEKAASKPTVLSLLDQYTDHFARCAEEFGFYVTPMTHFDIRKESSGNVKFVYSPRFSPDGQKGAILSNFRGSFKVRLDPANYCYPDFASAVPLKMKRGGVKSPAYDEIIDVYASLLAIRTIQVAASRLEFLQSKLRENQKLSLLHIAVHSGYNGTLLKSLTDGDKHLILENEPKLVSKLQSALEGSIPAAKDQALTLHRREISTFVHDYLRLIHLSYCETPLLGKRPPSHYVPTKSVDDQAHESSLWVSDTGLVHGTRRILEKEERDRIDESRYLAAPSALSVIVVAGFLWMFLTWIWYSIIPSLLHVMNMTTLTPNHPMMMVVVAQPCVLRTALSMSYYLKLPLRLDSQTSSGQVLVAFTEALIRHLFVRLGYATPFDQELNTLKEGCQRQYRTWAMRLAVEEFHNARKRRTIRKRDCLFLLEALATTHKVQDGEEVIEGILPGTMKEQDEFLNIAVIEDEGDAFPLAQQDNSSLCADTPSSKLEAFHSVEAIVDDCLKFNVGDRVIVHCDDSLFCLPSVARSGIDSTALTTLKSTKGSISRCFPGHCFVHFDGDSSACPIAFPLSDVSPLDEYTLEAVNDEPILLENGCDSWNETADENSFDDEDVDEEEKKDEPVIAKTNIQERTQSLEDALAEGNWKFVRGKKHYVYSRRYKLPTGEIKKQSVTFSKTPSDHRARKNALATLRRMNETHEALEEQASSNRVSVEGNAAKEENPAFSFWCAACQQNKSKSDFSRTQLKKTSRKCKTCTVQY